MTSLLPTVCALHGHPCCLPCLCPNPAAHCHAPILAEIAEENGLEVTEETSAEMARLGTTIAQLMSEEQLAACFVHYVTNHRRDCMLVPYRHPRTLISNRWRSCIKMPAGGAHAGGSQQTGFELDMITAGGVRELFGHWPNHEVIKYGHSWEARSMSECASVLNFGEKPAGWGVKNAKPIPPITGSNEHAGVLMVGPPLTATWRLKNDLTTSCVVRAPIIIYTEDDVVILPPDDKHGVPFYVDPPNQPGLHRDMFRSWAKEMIGELMETEKFELTLRLEALAVHPQVEEESE